MHYREDPYRMAYELRAPNHRLTPELLHHLEIAADYVTRYPPIYLNVYHMATQQPHAIPDHDVYVNTREMTYCVELHETPVCLVQEKSKNELDQYSPCECHEVYCSRCQLPFMAMTEDCAGMASLQRNQLRVLRPLPGPVCRRRNSGRVDRPGNRLEPKPTPGSNEDSLPSDPGIRQRLNPSHAGRLLRNRDNGGV